MTQSGFFESMIAPDSPFILIVTSYPDFATYSNVARKVFSSEGSDEGLEKARKEFYSGAGLGYVRFEVSLLRTFGLHPAVGDQDQGRRQAAGVRTAHLRIE